MPALVEALLGHVPDVLVLTEHRHNGASILLREELSAAGLHHQVVSHDGPRVNHLLIALRRPLQAVPQRALGFDRQRLLSVRVDNLRLVAAHVPNLHARLPPWQARCTAFALHRKTKPSRKKGRSVVRCVSALPAWWPSTPTMSRRPLDYTMSIHLAKPR